MKKLILYGKIVNGILKLDHRAMMTEYISQQKDQDVEIEVRSPKKDPSLVQWAYLYGSVYHEVGDHFGWTLDEVDTWMKKKFMKENLIVLPDGLMLTKTVFDRVWLAKYVDSCIRYAAFEGVNVAPPKLKSETKA